MITLAEIENEFGVTIAPEALQGRYTVDSINMYLSNVS